jgi:hypothetical protein
MSGLEAITWQVVENHAPALLNVDHVFYAHLRPSVIVLARSLSKAKETVKFRANIASVTYSFCEWKDALCQFMYYFQFSVFLSLQLVAPHLRLQLEHTDDRGI